MKFTLAKTTILTGLVIGSNLTAVEPPKPIQPGPAPEEIAPEKEAPIIPLNQKAWLGVMSFPVDDLLSSHLGIQEGVVLQVVSDKSPAAQAGLQVHDIITGVNGQAVKDHLCLRDMIHGKNAGDEITLEIISKGQKKKVTAKLSARPDHLGHRQKNLPPQQDRGFGLNLREQLNQALPMVEGFDERVMKEHVENLRKQFEQMQGEAGGQEGILKQLFQEFPELQVPDLNNGDHPGKEGGQLELQLNDLLKKVIPGGNGQAGLSMNSTVRVKDPEGVVEMKMNNGNKDLCIKGPQGEILYEGPYNNEQDKADVPADLKHRIKGIEMQGNRGLQLRLGGEKAPDAAPDPVE